ncbi:hypothetical protein PIROE2DRAFT_6346 [Piromyces sp. E2]|nr:hypothetical protein PIROE2DRAFT_6346 [Piromyces sp. E2]|eukprot:OUM66405.1 hypothetical protein PIROE2DRAFT_6346 [Piromyces sp. E2]
MNIYTMKKYKLFPSFSSKCKKVNGTVGYCSEDVDDKMIREDYKAKCFISMNSFDVWSLLKKTYKMGNEERKLNLRNQLNSMRFDENGDICRGFN